MKVLVDTSVWSLALRKGGPADHPAVGHLAALLEGHQRIVLSGIILQEILQTYRAETSFRRIQKHLEPFPLLDLTRSDFIDAAALHRRCADRGITTSTVDCQIAVTAIRHDCALLTADRDFRNIARVTRLQVIGLDRPA